jgi:hypothetical protein
VDAAVPQRPHLRRVMVRRAHQPFKVTELAEVPAHHCENKNRSSLYRRGVFCNLAFQVLWNMSNLILLVCCNTVFAVSFLNVF